MDYIRRLCFISLRQIVFFIYLMSMFPSTKAVPRNSAYVYIMCGAQCLAWCKEDKVQCREQCSDFSHAQRRDSLSWEMNFEQEKEYTERTELLGSCSGLKLPDKGDVPRLPVLRLWRPSQERLVLYWEPDRNTSSYVVYLVAERETHVSAWTIYTVNNNFYNVDLKDACQTPTFKLASMSKYGSRWFGLAIRPPPLIPGKPRDLRLKEIRYVYADSLSDKIEFRLSWRSPKGWQTENLSQFRVVKGDVNCPTSHYVKPMLLVRSIKQRRGEGGEEKQGRRDEERGGGRGGRGGGDGGREEGMYTLVGSLTTSAIGCQIYLEISAVSKCNSSFVGPAANLSFTINCGMVPDYKGEYCKKPEISVPGRVQDVRMTLVPYRLGLMGLVSWQPPTDLGSAGFVEEYHVFYGVVKIRNRISFVGHPQHVVTNGTVVSADVYFNVTNLDPYQSIGVTVMAAGPTQVVKDPFGTIYTPPRRFDVSIRRGDIIVEENDFFIVEVDQDLPATNSSADHVAVEIFWRRPNPETRVNLTNIGWTWGLLKDKNSDKTSVNNDTLTFLPHTTSQRSVDKEITSLVLTGLTPNATYGVKMMKLYANESLPGVQDRRWRMINLTVFTAPPSAHGTASGLDCHTSPHKCFPQFGVIGKIPYPMPGEGIQRSLQPSEHISGNTTETPGVVELQPEDSRDWLVVRLSILVSSLVILFVIALVVVLLWRRRRSRRRNKHIRLAVSEPPEFRPYFLYRPGLGISLADDDDEFHCPVVADEWELPLSCLKFGPILGQGAFGKVVKGRVTRAMLAHRGVMSVLAEGGQYKDDDPQDRLHVTVAIKMLPDLCDEKHKKDFLKEIQLMKRIGHHNHVVSILGCRTLKDPICLVVEHMANGDLLTHLKGIRHYLTNPEEERQSANYVNQGKEPSSTDLLDFALQITKGMDFLAGKGFVHRDLAARNVLVDSNRKCKIGDFGLTRFMYDDAVYVNRHGGRLPIKWMSVEAIFDMSFSTASDVWSFGVVLFELVTLGGTPYPTIPSRMLLKKLKRGYRMERPDNCCQEIYDMMLSCWREDPAARPTFDSLSVWLEAVIKDKSGVEYLNMDVDPRKDMYQNIEESDGEEDIRALPECDDYYESRVSGNTSGPVSSLTLNYSDVRDVMTDPITPANSEDSGYTTPKKCSTSSGESNESYIQMTGSGQYHGVGNDRPLSGISGFKTSTTPTHSIDATKKKRLDLKGSGKLPPDDVNLFSEDIVDDVFHEAVISSNVETITVLRHENRLRKTHVLDRHQRWKINNIASSLSDGETHKWEDRTKHSSRKMVKIRRVYSDSQLSRGNVEETLMKGNTLRLLRLSTTQSIDSAASKKRHDPPLRDRSRGSSAAMRKKGDVRKKTGVKARRKAVVKPPTLAIQNGLYFSFDLSKRQQPPPTCIRRRLCSTECEACSPEDKSCPFFPPLTPDEDAQIKIPDAQNANLQTSRRRRISSVFQYIVLADVHKAVNEDDKERKEENAVKIDVIQAGPTVIQTPPSPRLKKTFVRPPPPINSCSSTAEPDASGASMVDGPLPRHHQYTNFDDILKHTFSPSHILSSNPKAFIFNSVQCLAQHGTKEDSSGTFSPLINAYQRSFSEDSALDLCGLDLLTGKDSDHGFAMLKGLSYLDSQDKNGRCSLGNSLLPPNTLERRLSDPYAKTDGMHDPFRNPFTRRDSSNSNSTLLSPDCFKSHFFRFLSLRKEDQRNRVQSPGLRSQAVASEKHPSALHWVKQESLG